MVRGMLRRRRRGWGLRLLRHECNAQARWWDETECSTGEVGMMFLDVGVVGHEAVDDGGEDQ